MPVKIACYTIEDAIALYCYMVFIRENYLWGGSILHPENAPFDKVSSANVSLLEVLSSIVAEKGKKAPERAIPEIVREVFPVIRDTMNPENEINGKKLLGYLDLLKDVMQEFCNIQNADGSEDEKKIRMGHLADAVHNIPLSIRFDDEKLASEASYILLGLNRYRAIFGEGEAIDSIIAKCKKLTAA